MEPVKKIFPAITTIMMSREETHLHLKYIPINWFAFNFLLRFNGSNDLFIYWEIRINSFNLLCTSLWYRKHAEMSTDFEIQHGWKKKRSTYANHFSLLIFSLSPKCSYSIGMHVAYWDKLTEKALWCSNNCKWIET